MKRLIVHLSERSYPLLIGTGFAGLGPLIGGWKGTPKALVVTNTTVHKLYFTRLARELQRSGIAVSSAVIPDGEEYKRLDTLAQVYRRCCAAGLDRRSVIVALGGGVVGDLAGFAAATYLRGVPFVQVPTTLLAMVDSSVGGKTGVDLREGKNLVGAFYQPKAVWINVATLETLPAREVRNGLAEVIKYGVIADRAFFASLERLLKARKAPGRGDYERIIFRCCAVKARVVEQDEREEKGVREMLNFGHTFGHAIETLTGYRAYAHGEAVAIGMSLAGRLAERMGLFGERRRIEEALRAAGLPSALPPRLSSRAMVAAMMKDKKVRGGKLRFVLPEKIGKVVVRQDVPETLVREVLS